MKNDPIVEEVRKIRFEIEREYENDDEKYFQHLLSFQKKMKERLVSREPKRTSSQFNITQSSAS